MKVSALSRFINSLKEPLRQSGASAKMLQDMEQTCTHLESFAELDVGQLSDLLRQADEYCRNGTLSEPTKGRGKTTSRSTGSSKQAQLVADVAELAQKVLSLKERAALRESSREELESGLTELRLKNLKKDILIELAKELGCKVTARMNITDLIHTIHREVLEGKETLESAPR